MEDEIKIPRMLEFLFGKAAKAAQQGASERLMAWCRAFEAWMAERGSRFGTDTTKQTVLTWRRLMRERQKMPWELGRADIDQHSAWMRTEGYAPTTIGNAIGIIGNFYRWCDERRVDAACEAGFNPAEGVQRPKIQRYASTKLLSQGEMRALLRVLAKDNSPVGRRDHALFLARLRLGAPTEALRQLRWGQIEVEGTQTWVRWRAEAARVQLSGDAWEAIQAYLTASGRSPRMQDEVYVFPPLIRPLQEETGSEAEDWNEGRPLSRRQLLTSLKLYGRLAGIAEEKLTLIALRHTATRLRLDEGDNLEEMQSFLDSREGAKMAKYRLGKLPSLPEGTGGDEAGDELVQAPLRKPRPFQPGEGTIHGLYARSQTPEIVEAMLRENIVGIEEVIVGMRILARGLLERQERASGSLEMARLGNAYTLSAARLAELIKAENQMAEAQNDRRVKEFEEFLERANLWAIENGEPPVSEAIRAEVLGGTLELSVSDRRLVEEIAATRYVLRKTLALAMEAETTEEYIRLTETYNNGCNRLMRMLRTQKNEHDQIEVYIQDALKIALADVIEDWGLR